MNISIIITTYNAEAYLADTLRSITNQTYSHYEVIIIDDGSQDTTLKIISDYCAAHPTSNIHLHPLKHIGRAAALNIGIEKAKYDWIAIIDADDLWHCNKLAMQVEAIQKHDLVFLATKYKLFSYNADINTHTAIPAFIQPNLLPVRLNQMLCTNVISHSSVLFKKNLVRYDIKRKSQVDYEMWLRLLQQGVPIYMLNHCLAYHRIHKGQSFEAKKPLRYALNATSLQLKYCLLNLKLGQTLFVIFKLGCYFLPRKIRFKVRDLYTAKVN